MRLVGVAFLKPRLPASKSMKIACRFMILSVRALNFGSSQTGESYEETSEVAFHTRRSCNVVHRDDFCSNKICDYQRQQFRLPRQLCEHLRGRQWWRAEPGNNDSHRRVRLWQRLLWYRHGQRSAEQGA